MDTMPVCNSRKSGLKEAKLRGNDRCPRFGPIGFTSFVMLIVSGAGVLRAQQSPLSITARPWQPEMSVGGPIAIELRVQNQSDSALTIDLGEDEKEGIQIRMSSPDGQTYSSNWKPKEGASLIGKIRISSGSEIERMIVLEDWNISPVPGHYDVAISFKYGAIIGAGDELPVQPVTVQLRVVKRDALLIRSECDLAKSLFLNSGNYNEAWVPANLLSKFSDPSALECLSQVYYSGSPYHFEPTFIRAIGNIGSDAARRTLTAIANGNRKEDAEIAAGVLQIIGNR